MKSAKIILIILTLFVLLNFIGKVEDGEITSRSVFDIRAVQVIGTSLSIIIDSGAPNVIISSPLNTTYNYNDINLNFTAYDRGSEIDKIWYNLNNTNNITITGNITFTSSEGSNTIYLFANDTLGFLNNSASVTFNVNSSRGYNVSHSEFAGSTTNFNSLNKSQQSNISNAKIHSPGYGKISFNENINISSDLSIDNYIEISDNSIIIDSSNLPNFNKAATLELYGLTFTNPKIQKDGSDCSSSICARNGYTGGTLSFNVTGFTEYSAVETPTGGGSPGGGTGGGGGGSGGSTTEFDDIKINKDAIKIKLRQDETKSDFLIIENKEEKSIKLTLTLEPEIEFLFIEDSLNKYDLEIDASEKKNVEFTAYAVDVKEGVYVSKLVIESDNFKSVLPVVIEVESNGARLFDVDVEILNEDKTVEQGKILSSKVILFNLGVTEEIEADIEYSILDLDGNAIVSETEKEFIETQFQKIKEIKIPSDAKAGIYVYAVKVKYLDNEQERILTSTAIFEITKKSGIEFPFKFELNLSSIIIIVLLAVIALFIVYQFRILRMLEKLHGHRRRKK